MLNINRNTTQGTKKPPQNEFEVAISYQNSEIVIACLKPRKFFLV